jgi:adenylate cyclase
VTRFTLTATQPPSSDTNVVPILGRYAVRELLGRGGMGEVYLAHDPDLDRLVAIKVIRARAERSPASRARFQREAQALARLSHPNVVTVYDVGSMGDTIYVAMERIVGPTLSAWLAERPRRITEIVEVFVQAGRGLAAAHDAGLVHRDFKPSNVMLGDRVRVVDFGLARLDLSDPDHGTEEDVLALEATVTAAGAVVGTPAYMAPEQRAGGKLDARADQFSFCVALEDALGDLPVGPAMQAVLERGLRHDPAGRFPSMHALLAELERAATRAVSSVAVVPFDDLSAARDHAYLCDGIAEEILTSLARVDGLRVAARAASFALRAETADPRAVGEKLGVDAVLGGSVRVAGDQLRVTVQLVATADGTQRWTKRFDGTAGDVFAIQDEIAIGVATALRGILEAADQQTLRRPETSPETYEHFLRGRRVVHHPSGATIPLAKKALERALEHDPTYAPAYAMLAQAHAWHCEWYGGGGAEQAAAELASQRALEFGPELAESHVARGAVLSSRGAYPEAERAFQRAIDLDRFNFDAHYLYARLCFQVGRHEDAIRLFYRGAQLRPEDFQCMLLITMPARQVGRAEEGLAAMREGVRRARRALELDPSNLRALSLGGASLAELGDNDEALEWTRRAIAVGPDDAAALVNAACMFSKLGRLDEALDALEGCFGRGWGNRDWVLHDPDYDPLRGHPRFVALLEKLGQRG